ncbi:MAG: sodium:solute symporter family protein, partial [Planctomycetota bacterium]
WIELTALGTYLALLLWIGVRSARQVKTSVDFALAGRNVGFWVILATTAATMVGGGSTVGSVAKAATHGLAFLVATFGLHLQLMFTGLFVAPRLRDLQLITVGDFIEEKYGRLARGLAVLNCAVFLIGALAAQLVAMGKITESLLGIDYEWALVIGSTVTVFYATVGGIRAIIKTDVLQFVILFVGITTAAAILYAEHGGFAGFHEKLGDAPFRLTNEEFSAKAVISLFVAFLFGEMFTPPYATRSFIARNRSHARWGIAGGGAVLFLFLPISIFVLSLSANMDPEIVAAMTKDKQNAFSMLIRVTFHPVFAGVMIAALVAAVMSSADSCLSCGSTVVMEDIFRRYFRRDASDESLLRVARVSTVVGGVAATLFAWRWPDIIDLLEFVYDFWAPGMVLPFIVGVFWYKKERAPAVVASMVCGLAATVAWQVIGYKTGSKPWGFGAAIGGLAIAVLSYLVAWPIVRLSRRGAESTTTER